MSRLAFNNLGPSMPLARTACRDTQNPEDLEYYSDSALERVVADPYGPLHCLSYKFSPDDIKAELLRRKLSKL